ncbi:Protein S100-A4 [Dissostichus eleginoides]|uniref:Protein S100 n=2 Tax=Dissostichus eleginoides TaxID=100907 RepID=A0AAD9C642_DISEL|nr:Protein S100-A4 [Dissostichus eleginoides]
MGGSMLEAMVVLMKNFNKYAGKDADKSSISKAELSDLLNTEIPGMVGDKKELDAFFAGLDGDKDGTVSFNEYIVLVGSLMMILKEMLDQ